MFCSQCSAQIAPGSRFCSKCAAPVAAAVDPNTVETVAMEMPAHSSVVHKASSSLPVYRFQPGQLLASRYRIISRLGKGGMGEVFRADDILLGQAVALKFLPEEARGNVNLLTRFYDEARIARQITHANVCRVYDIGEVDGQAYLSMEYIDGEELGSLLRRIGRLPSAKAVEFARKMCAGLAAAHKQGVLHRDLKPANIMIDGRGELHIMDFGLAALAKELHGTEARSGTPAYMAPEQLEGREVSVQSDLYALGLIFYEMFTGKPPHQAESVDEMLRLRRSSASVTNPSQLAGDIDPAVERAILRCLEADPKLRPVSAMALAASLPGGDPLAAALAAGETPSPEVVAASGSTEGLSPRVAVAALVAVLAGLAATAYMIQQTQVVSYLKLENPSEVLRAKVREIVASLGYSASPADTQAGFFYNNRALASGQVKASSPAEWHAAIAKVPSPILYAYRQSPAPLVSQTYSNFGRVNGTDPYPSTSGMLQMWLDPDGRLVSFDAVPPQLEKGTEFPKPDWAPLFAAAHLDVSTLKPDDPQWVPLAATDVRAAWTGMYPGVPDFPIRVEAAAFHGRPIHFELIWPWSRPARMPGSNTLSAARQAANVASSLLPTLFFFIAMWLAHHNWKAGRGDLRGATRLAIYMASVSMLKWVLSAHHVGDAQEQQLFGAALSEAAYTALQFWISYLALEPWVRRYWPQTLVTWSRLLAGRWKDPLVGRDVLFGILLGVVYSILFQSYEITNLYHGSPPETAFIATNLNSVRFWAYTIAGHLDDALGGALYFFMILFVLRAVLRKQWLGGLAFVLIFVAMRAPNQGAWYGPIFIFAIFSTIVVVMLRFGVFATMCLMFTTDTIPAMLMTTDFTAWYGQSSWVIVALLIGVTLWAFRTSLGGRQLIPAMKA